MKKTKGKEEKDCIFWDKHYKNPKQILQLARWVASQNNYWKTALILNEKCSYRCWVVILIIEGLWQLATKRAPVVCSSGDNTQLMLFIDCPAPGNTFKPCFQTFLRIWAISTDCSKIPGYDDLNHSTIYWEFCHQTACVFPSIFNYFVLFVEFKSVHFQFAFQKFVSHHEKTILFFSASSPSRMSNEFQ